MKTGVAIACLALAWTAAAAGKEYQSSFGFTVDIPDNWLALTKQAIAENPALTGEQSTTVGSINPDLLKDIKTKVESGSIEMFFDRTTSDASFADNVNVLLKHGQAPDGPDKVKSACDAYPAALAKYAGRALAVSKCEARDLGATKAFYVEYEGVVAGTVTMQYQINRPDGQVLYVTATCKRASVDRFTPEFEAIVKSLRFS